MARVKEEMQIEEVSAKANLASIRRSNIFKNVCIVVLLCLVAILVAIIFIVRYTATNNSNYNNNNNNINSNNNNNNINSSSNNNKNINSHNNSNNKMVADLCLNSYCIMAASNIMAYMNLSADPCEDFREFACGKFLDEFTLPDDRDKYNAYIEVQDIIYSRGKVMMEKEEEENEMSAMKKAKIHYKSCLNETKLDELGLEPMKSKLILFGGWPVIEGEKWNGDNYTWYEAVYEMGRQGFGTDFLVTLSVDEKANDTTTRQLTLDYPDYGISWKYFQKGIDGEEVQEYLTYMKKVAVLFGADMHRAGREMAEVLKFEMALAETVPEDLLDSNIYSEYFWQQYVDQLMLIADSEPHQLIWVEDHSHLHKVSRMLENTDPRILANYLGWKVTESVLQHLNSDAFIIKQKFLNAIFGEGAAPSRWKLCLTQIGFNDENGANFNIPISSVYAGKYFDMETRKEISSMIESVREVYKSEFQHLEWMDNVTRSNVLNKLDDMIVVVGYPEQLLNWTRIDQLFTNLNVSEDDYLGNYNRLTLWDRRFSFRRVKEKIDRMDWIDLSMVTAADAVNYRFQNAMVIPAGIVQGRFYGKNLPKYLNYGAIGTIAAHEMTHGFDTNALKVDFKRRLEETWEAATKDIFLNKTNCLYDQYNKAVANKYGDLFLGDDDKTLDEDIADNGGINQAFRAYDQWVNTTGIEEPRLPGLDHLTPQQLFFISYGQLYCNKFQSDALKDLVVTGMHSPDDMRQVLPLINSEHFAKVFNCKLGSQMNPPAADKCHVW